MTLDRAIDEAFGRTDSVRRKSWPAGTWAFIDALSKNKFYPFLCMMMSADSVHGMPSLHQTEDARNAEDWYPCSHTDDPVVENWRSNLVLERDGETRSIGRGAKCRALLNDHHLSEACTLVWAELDQISLAVPEDSIDGWPNDGMIIAMGRLLLSSGGVHLPFHLLQVCHWLSRDGLQRRYNLVVVRSDR